MGGLEPSSNQAGSGEQFKREDSIPALDTPEAKTHFQSDGDWDAGGCGRKLAIVG
jgi:hypothetical protein